MILFSLCFCLDRNEFTFSIRVLFHVDGLMNTGLGAVGDLDPYWKVISVPSGTPGFTAGSNAIIMTASSGWSNSPSWPSKWIGVNNNGNTGVKGGNYVYQLSFASGSYVSKIVEVYFLVEDAVTSVTVSDGSSIIQTITTFSGGNSWKCFSRFVLTAFGPKTTVLTFTVNNGCCDGLKGGGSGLMVQFGPPLVPCKSSLPVNKMSSVLRQLNFPIRYILCRLSRWFVLEFIEFAIL